MYGGLLLIAFGLSAATGSSLRIAASFALLFVLDRKVRCISLLWRESIFQGCCLHVHTANSMGCARPTA